MDLGMNNDYIRDAIYRAEDAAINKAIDQAMTDQPDTPDQNTLKILDKFFEAAYSQREADMDTPYDNNRVFGDAARELNTYYLQLALEAVGSNQEHGSGVNVSWEAGIDWSNQTKDRIREALVSAFKGK